MGEGWGAGRAGRAAAGQGTSSHYQQGLEHPKPCFCLRMQSAGAAARIPGGPSSNSAHGGGDQAQAQEEAHPLQGCPACRERGDGATGFHHPLGKLPMSSSFQLRLQRARSSLCTQQPTRTSQLPRVARTTDEAANSSREMFGYCELSLQGTHSLPG